MLSQNELIETLSPLQPILILDEYTLTMIETPKSDVGFEEDRI
jgi:hypothetical protein